MAGGTPGSKHILNFRGEHPDATLVTLTTNYRCTPDILAVANRISKGLGEKLDDKTLEAACAAGGSCQSPAALEALPGKGRAAAEALVALLADCRVRIHGGDPLSAILAHLVRETNYSAHWHKDPENLLGRMENVQELIAVADDFGAPPDLLPHFRHCRDQATRRVKDAVVLSTIHRAKRRHSALGYCSPNQFEERNTQPPVKTAA